MLSAIEFDHQQFLRSTEIRKEWSDWKLSSKLYAVQLSASEAIPQFLLCIDLRASQFSRSISA
jgi:hypothetical protein